jgi:hypothetical protein
VQIRPLVAIALLATTFMWAANPLEPSVSRDSAWPPQSGASFRFGGPYEIPYKAVPTTLTDLSTRDSHIIGYCFYNSTGGTVTLTVQTKDATPVPLPLSGPITSGVSVCFNAAWGILSKGGWSVQASGTGVFYHGVWTN